MVNTVGLAPLLLPDLKNVYVEEGKERPPEHGYWANVSELEWQGEKDLHLAGLGTMPAKAQGSPFSTSEPILGGTKAYTATPFGLALEITWEMYRDDLYGVMVELIQGLSRAARFRQEVASHSVLNNAFSTSYVGFTASQALVQRSHTLLDGNTLHNTPATSQSFSVLYLQGMIQRFHAMTTHRDAMPRLMAPRTILITPQNLFVAREILGSTHKPFTADNEVNSILQEELSYAVNHFITNQSYHFTLAAKGEHDLNFKWRDHEMFDMYDDPRLKAAVATVYQRHTLGEFGAWEGTDGSGN